MRISDMLAPADVVLDLRAQDKRRLLDEVARRSAGLAQVSPAAIAEALNGREKLGSTGLGGGIAIPHARLPSLTRPLGLFARLRPPLDFDAIDAQKVDLVFLLLLPAQTQGEHLNTLASVARKLRDQDVKAALRRAHDVDGLYALLTRDDEE